MMSSAQTEIPTAETDEMRAGGAVSRGQTRSLSFVAPRHPDGSDWPWLSQIGPMRKHRFTAVYVENTFRPLPKLTGQYVRWQYLRAMQRIAGTELAFLFSTDVNVGMTRFPAKWLKPPRRVYVGFTQDGPWPQEKIDRLARAMQQLDAITVFSGEEREMYIARYGLDARRVHLIHIHTDETGGYSQYPDARPMEHPYILSLGSPNRCFTPIARACHQLKVPLVIITRPWHQNDSLDELTRLGATIITDANKMKALTWLKHARFMVMAFQTDQLPGAFTTIIHGMFMGTPSIVTTCLGMRDYVIGGETGFITPHNDEAALQSAIDHLWNDPDLVERLSATASARARRFHSLESAAQRFEALAQDVLAEPPSPTG